MSKKRKEGASTEASTIKEEAVEAAVPEILDPDTEFSALSKEEMDALRKKAQELAKKETKQKIEDEFLKAEVEKAKKEEAKRLHLESSKEEKKYLHTINLSSAADHVRIGGKVYKHGQTYEFTQGELSAIKDMEHRGHEQERIRKGQGRNEYGLRERDGIKSGTGVVRA